MFPVTYEMLQGKDTMKSFKTLKKIKIEKNTLFGRLLFKIFYILGRRCKENRLILLSTH